MSDNNANDEQNKKDHADFQDKYRRSSNFSQINEDETEELKIKGDGEVGLKKEEDVDSATDSEKIKDAMDQIDTGQSKD